MNMIKTIPQSNIVKVSELLQAISPQPRLEILIALGAGEACVCHLESAMGWRQAYISQHLMALRNEGLVTSRRDGRNIYYRIKNTNILDLVRKAADIAGISDIEATQGQLSEPLPNCTCPHCSALKTHIYQGEVPNLAIGSPE